MKTQDLMTRNVCACSVGDSLEQVTRQMWESDVGCLVVVDGDRKPIGMITDRDILMAAYTQGVALRDSRVSTAMARNVVTCSPSTPLSELENKMRTAQIRRLPVVDAQGKLVGIVALGDLVRGALSSPVHVAEIPGLAKTLGGITERRLRQATAAG